MGSSVSKKPSVELKTKAEVDKMRKAGEIAGKALKGVGECIRAGISTKELDRIAEKLIRQAGAVPTFVGYLGYPASLCVSINDEVVHGMPSEKRIVKAGDIVSIDIGATYDGFVGDTAATFLVEPVTEAARALVRVTEESLAAAIKMMRPGNRLGDIGAAIQNLAEAAGYGVVRDFVGHGIGRQMHESPAVPNYGTAGSGLRLEAGLVLAIEPMVTLGDYKVKTLKDGWTVVTEDGKLAAHFEHTVAITDNEPLVLTRIEN